MQNKHDARCSKLGKLPGVPITVSPTQTIPENFSSVVRHTIRDIYLEGNKVPTLNHILERLKQKKVRDFEHLNLFHGNEMPNPDSKIWIWGRSTLHRFMKSIGFIYGEKISHYEYTKNRADVISMRDNYLDWISKYREEGYRIYYQDETWVFKNMSCNKVWRDIAPGVIEESYKVPAGRGDRPIVYHVGCADTGLLDNYLLLFRGSKSNKSSDYHTEMNWSVFSDWCQSKVFPAMKNTKQKSVLVLDRATYHTFLDEQDRRPTTSWNKSKIADAISRWDGIPDDWPLTWRVKKTKDQLLQHAREIYPSPIYKIQKIANTFREGRFEIKILFLPVAHPELNPIEMLWSKVKRQVASKNMNFRLSTVEELTREAVAEFSASEFAKYVEHVLVEEQKFKELSTL